MADEINIKKACLVELSNNILNKNNRIALRKGTKDLYIYNNKFYELLSDFYLSQIIQKFYIDEGGSIYYSPSKADNIIKTIKSSPKISELEFDVYNNLINLNNGVLNLDTHDLHNHKDEYTFTYCLDVNFDPKNNECPNFTNFIQGIFTKETGEPDYETIENIFRLGGYLMYPQNKIEQMFIFLGSGENGKTMLIDILSSFFPQEFISNISLKTLSNSDSSERTDLIKSKVNISSEQKGEKIDDGEIKKIISGQHISIQRKFLEPINIKAKTKLLVDSNHIPYFNDTSWGMERRLALFDFKNTFLSKDKYCLIRNPEQKRIFLGKKKHEFMASIMKEKTAILNLFINGLIELKERGWRLQGTSNMEEMMSEYKDQTDTLGTWLLDSYKENENPENLLTDWISIISIAHEYAVYYDNNFSGKRLNCSTKLIGRRIKEKFKVKGKTIKTADGSTTTGYPLTKIYSY